MTILASLWVVGCLAAVLLLAVFWLQFRGGLAKSSAGTFCSSGLHASRGYDEVHPAAR